MRNQAFVLTSLLLLAACGTPQEQCIRNATAEGRKVDRLISEAEGNLARGYAYVTETKVVQEWETCIVPGTGGNGKPVQTTLCLQPSEVTTQRPLAIDPVAEQRKLENLRAKRKALAAQSDAAVAVCKQTYPES